MAVDLEVGEAEVFAVTLLVGFELATAVGFEVTLGVTFAVAFAVTLVVGVGDGFLVAAWAVPLISETAIIATKNFLISIPSKSFDS